MVVRSGNSHDIIAHLQSKLSAPQKLLVLPTGCVGVSTQTRKPLSNLVDVIPIFLEKLTTTSPPKYP